MKELKINSLSDISQDIQLGSVAYQRVGSAMSFDFLRNTVDQWQALAMLRLVFPRLLQCGNLVFLAENATDETVEAFRKKGVQGPELERVINHIHLWDILKEFEYDGDAYNGIMEFLSISWPFWIKRCTGRIASIEKSSGPEDYGPTITFITE